MTTNLNFRKPYIPPAGNNVKLNFSLTGDDIAPISGVVTLRRTVTMHITGPAPQPATPRMATITLRVPTVQAVHIQAAYDNRVFRGPTHAPDGTWQQGTPTSPAKGDDFEQAATARARTGESWGRAKFVERQAADAFIQALRLRARASDQWQPGANLRGDLYSPFEFGIRVRAVHGDKWEVTTSTKADWTDHFQYPPHLKPHLGSAWQKGKPMQAKVDYPFGRAAKLPYAPRLPWEEGKPAHVGLGEQPPVQPPVTPPYDGTGKPLDFICPWLDYPGYDVLLKFGLHPCPPIEPPDGETVIVPVKRVYIVLNTTSLRRVDGNVLLPTFSLSLGIDANSWTWGFNAALPAETLDAIEPGSDGTPVELEAMINGTAYRVLAEQISRDRTFGRSAIRVSGKGKSAILGAPYASVQNFSNQSAARTAQQLMNDALTVNGASIGWTVNWAATDWLVPAGAWSHQGSYITALNSIAGAAGAYIQPHPSLKTLNVLPKYPTAPWNWGSLVPDFELPADVTTRESIEWLERPRYNRVFVSGQGQGVLGQVTRGGTAGDIVAPMIADALITHADAARQRGLAVLGDTGRQAHLSLRLPVLEETGVIQPGKFVRHVDGGVTRIGIVRSTSVDASNPEVWQTIGVETHVATA